MHRTFSPSRSAPDRRAGELTGAEVRPRTRAGLWRATTRGAARGYVQCNVVIVPGDLADRFAAWCDRNPAVAPVLARSRPGDPQMPELGDIDLLDLGRGF